MWDAWKPFLVVIRHMDAPSQCVTIANISPDLWDRVETLSDGNDYSIARLFNHSNYILLTSMPYYTYKVFEHLLLLWIGIWMHSHTHTATITSLSPDLGELVEILGDGHVQKMPLYSKVEAIHTCSDWISHPCHTCIRCLSTFWCCG